MATGTLSYSYLELATGGSILIRSTDNASIPLDLANRDYQDFLTWLGEPGSTAPTGWTGPTNPTTPPEGQTPPPAS